MFILPLNVENNSDRWGEGEERLPALQCMSLWKYPLFLHGRQDIIPTYLPFFWSSSVRRCRIQRYGKWQVSWEPDDRQWQWNPCAGRQLLTSFASPQVPIIPFHQSYQPLCRLSCLKKFQCECARTDGLMVGMKVRLMSYALSQTSSTPCF